jgi:carboxyl-terminal processing protease
MTYTTFLTNFEKDDSFISKFESYLKNAGLDIKLNNNKQIVNTHLTAEFARQLFGETQYYQILLKDDLMIKAVLK